MNTVKHRAVRRLANELLKEHGLDGWRFEFSRAKRRLGLCRYRSKVISVSAYHAEFSPISDVKNTILHEIAHALVGFDAGHGPIWQRKAAEIGAKPERCGDGSHVTKNIQYKYTLTCPNGHQAKLHRLTKNWKRGACGECCNRYNNGRYSSEYTWNIVQHY